MSALAAQAGVGKATLSEIEAGRRNPTLETLYALAAELQVPLAELLVEGDPPDGTILPVTGSAVQALLWEVFTDAGVSTEVYRLSIRPGTRQLSPGHGPGVTEHLHVLHGCVLAGPVGRAERAAAGGRLVWDSSGPHQYSADGPEPAEAVLVLRTPRQADATGSPPSGRPRPGSSL